MTATSGFLTALGCTKFDFGRGSPGPRLGSLQRSLRPPSWFKGPTSKGRRGKGTGKEGREERKRGRGGTGNGGWKGSGRDARVSGGKGRGREEGEEGREEEGKK